MNKWVVEAYIGKGWEGELWVIVVPTDGMPWKHESKELAELAMEILCGTGECTYDMPHRVRELGLREL